MVDATFVFNHVFGPDSNGKDVYIAAREGLVRRALACQVGVVFACRQMGSGKMHLMNGLIDRLVTELFIDSSKASTRRITFSYMEIMGSNIKDYLAMESNVNGLSLKVQIGKLLDRHAVVKGLSKHRTSCSGASFCSHWHCQVPPRNQGHQEKQHLVPLARHRHHPRWPCRL